MRINSMVLGNSAGLVSGVSWAVNTVLIGVALTLSPLNNHDVIFFAPFLSNFLNDLFVFFWTFSVLILRKKLSNLLSVIKSKNGVVLFIAGILGGPLGMLFYVLSVKYAGSTHASIISSIYPILGAVIARFVMKDKLSTKTYLGLILIIFSVSYLSFHPEDTNDVHPHFILGLLFAFIAALGWGLQGVFLSWGMKSEKVSQHVALVITVSAALFFDLFVILPSLGAMKLIIPVIFSSPGAIAFIAAAVGALSTWMYYVSVHLIGPARAMGLNITYGIWVEVIQWIFMRDHLNSKLVISSIVIVIGVCLSAARKSDAMKQGSVDC